MTPAVSTEELRARIRRLPRLHIAALPTPLQVMPRLADALAVSELRVKRDDLTGIGLGGNKSRGLELILADARERGCDVLVAGGGGEQSNHAVQCAAAANRAGLDSVLVLQRRPDARANGNALLHELVGGRTVWVESDPGFKDRRSAVGHMHAEAERLAAEGRKPYVLESSLHPLSVVAYVEALVELCEQLADEQELPTLVYVTSEGAALGGLLLGTRLLGLPWEVTGLDWRPQEPGVASRLDDVVRQAADLLGLTDPLHPDDFVIRSSGGPAYGVGRPESWEALELASRTEGLLLDPVYTAKGLAGARADLDARGGYAGRVVFVHTGGVGALFAYQSEIEEWLARRTERGEDAAGTRTTPAALAGPSRDGEEASWTRS